MKFNLYLVAIFLTFACCYTIDPPVINHNTVNDLNLSTISPVENHDTVTNTSTNSSTPATTPKDNTTLPPLTTTTKQPVTNGTVPTTTTTTLKPTTTTTTTTTTPTTTTKVTTTSLKPTESPTNSSTIAPRTTPNPHSRDRKFDGPSFIGGIVLACGLTAIGFVAFKFYKARTERNYHTLNGIGLNALWNR